MGHSDRSPTHPSQGSLAPRRRGGLGTMLGGLGGLLFILVLALLWLGPADETLRDRMNAVYDLCAVLGGTLVACQFLLSLVGLGHHHDIGGSAGAEHEFGGADAGHDSAGHDHSTDTDHEAHSSWFVGLLTFRTIVLGLAFFGLAGRAASAADIEPGPSLVVALAAGGAALFGVAYLMRSLYRLRADGSVRIERAVGCCGTVYLSVPAQKGGAGKVLLNVQNRTMEYQAVTAQDALPTGSPVRVVAVVSPDTVEVTLASTSERIQHA